MWLYKTDQLGQVQPSGRFLLPSGAWWEGEGAVVPYMSQQRPWEAVWTSGQQPGVTRTCQGTLPSRQVRGWRCCSEQEPEARGLPTRRSISDCNSSFQTLSIFILSHPSSRLSILRFEELPALVFLSNKTQLWHLRFGLAFLCPWPRARCVGLPPSPWPDTGSLDGNSNTLCLFSNQSL